MLKHIVMYSFGESSWYEGKLCVERFGPENTLLLFADTKSEDDDTYAWGRAAAKALGMAVTEIADGRDIWQVFKDERFLGNTRADPCSKILKRKLCDAWVAANYRPDECVLHYGISLFERERLDDITERVKPYKAESLLCQKPYPGPADVRKAVLEAGLWVQKLYRLGFSHANCAGMCVKAGQAHWAMLLEKLPSQYAIAEAKEEEVRQHLGKDVSILRDRRGGTLKPLPLAKFRQEIQAGREPDAAPTVGGCSCFSE